MPAPPGQAPVELVELRSQGGEALPLGHLAARARDLLAVAGILGEPRELCGGELRLLGEAVRQRDGRPGCSRLEPQPAQPGRGGDEHGRLVQHRRARRTVTAESHVDSRPQAAGHIGMPGEGLRPQQEEWARRALGQEAEGKFSP